jgi:lipopolysaccharide transport system permease protein
MRFTILRYRSLFLELTKREFSAKYLGSLGGICWSFAQPLFLLSIYTIAFAVILKARWGFAGSTSDYAFMLFAGLIVYNAFSEVLVKSTTLVTNNPNFIKKIVFPIQILPVVTVATALIHALISVAVWLIGYALIIGAPKATILMFPLVLICLIV